MGYVSTYPFEPFDDCPTVSLPNDVGPTDVVSIWPDPEPLAGQNLPLLARTFPPSLVCFHHVLGTLYHEMNQMGDGRQS